MARPEAIVVYRTFRKFQDGIVKSQRQVTQMLAGLRCLSRLPIWSCVIRYLKTVDLQIRPIYHWLAERVRAHVFLSMVAYYLEWHMRQLLAPMLYDSFRTLLADLATLTRNTLVTAIDPRRPFTLTSRPTALQQKALDLLGLARTQ